MKKLILFLTLALAAGLAQATPTPGTPPYYTIVSPADGDLFYLWHGGAMDATTPALMKAYTLNSMSTGLTVSGTTVTVTYGTSSGTALQGSALGTTVQPYSSTLVSLSGTTNPLTAGSGVSFSGTWPNITISAPTSSYTFGTGLTNAGSVITVNYGTTAGTALQGNAIGSTVQAYNSTLQALSAGTWVGASNITTTGTITTGTWNATPIDIAHGGAAAWELKSSNFTAVAGHKYQIDSSGTVVTMTLPGTATTMDAIEVQDATLTWDTHNVTLNRNGLKINNGTSNYNANVLGGKLSIVYISSGYGWSIK